ncbi:PAS domain-containing protein [Chryseolinea lacunae]|uniref:PAS domain-containing protein n=1 Tax=Chryseolinea lacunae TaxID=2801331 RepID=A0ABS1KXH5_9BACT|nr:PAS domain-containing protein [Chryseolinea lacunae]MBL0743922.1 PAS domain-containing protein [Chryseolinea lacunae]
MKIFPYTLVKKEKISSLHQQLTKQQEHVTGATEFVKAIEQGNLDIPYGTDGTAAEDNLLASSLVSMRDQMKKFSAEEKQRNWVSEGLARFVDILRSKNNDITQLSNEIISQLVKYLDANQGALYVINDDENNDKYLELAACYAYNRQKHLSQRFELGEGIIGQVVLEKQTSYLKEIPKNYVRITSGLGESLPRNLLIVPLKIEERVYGVVEIASFSVIRKYQIDFVERLGESIASTISAAKANARTQKLLQETQAQAEQMRSQEEEMRQNMEELSATQEEMHRVLKEVQGKETYMTDLIDASTDSILTIDRQLKVINCNKIFKATYTQFEIDKGFDVTLLFAAEDRQKYRNLYDRVFEGESFNTQDHYKFGNIEAFYIVSYSPLRNDKGEVIAAAIFVKDVTEITKAKNEAQHQTEELKAQEEELRQNMEELSATQDEMQRVFSEVQAKERYMTDLIDTSTDSILSVDHQYRVVNFNKTLHASYSGMGINIEKGFEMKGIFSEAEWPKFRGHYERALKGEKFEVTEEYHSHGFDSYFTILYSPLRNEKDEIIAAAVFAKDITASVKLQKETEALLAESQQSREELKAQEEELRQNMEELSATQEEMNRVLLEVQNKERYLLEVLSATNDSIFTMDKEYKIIGNNRVFGAALEALGFPVKKGFNMLSVFEQNPAQMAQQKAYYDRALAGEFFEITEAFDTNGVVTHFANHYAPVKDEQGNVYAIACYAKDVTPLVNARNENIEVRKTLEVRENVFGVTTILSESDLFGNVIYANDKLCTVSKYTREELVGKPHSLFRHPDMPKALFKDFWATIKKGDVFRGIIKNKAKDGSTYWVDASIVPVKDDAGKIVKYIGARHHIEDEDVALLLYNRQAKRLNLPVLSEGASAGQK